MKWEDGRRSDNVEDQRGAGGNSGSGLGGLGGLSGLGGMGGGGRGRPPVAIGGAGLLVLVVVVYLLGGDPMALLAPPGGPGGPGQGGGPAVFGPEQADPPLLSDPEEEKLADFVRVVLADTEDVWHKLFREQVGRDYVEPKLVLFRERVSSSCGYASAAVGPFYCPADEKVYLDLAFYDDLQRRFEAPGDFAQAYVIAHEVGHHVQNLLGFSDKVHAQKGRVSDAQYNDLSVRLELQADFFAGVWAHHAQKMRQLLEQGDIEEALRCAQAIGDDRIQMRSKGYVVPESFTHGSSEQRARWFRKGLTTGDMEQGNTFEEERL